MMLTILSPQLKHYLVLASSILGLLPIASEAQQFVALPNNTAPNANPDAWGKVPVPGFNLQEPYPGSPVPWTLELNMTQNGTSHTRPNHKNNTTLITARLIPPPPGSPGAVLDADGLWALNDTDAPDSWHVTMLSWVPTSFKEISDKNDLVNGSCPTGAVSEACMDAMRTSIVASPTFWGSNPTDPYVSAPKVCRDSNGPFWTSLSSDFAMNQNFTKDAMIGWNFVNEGPGFDPYNQYGVKMFIVATIWAPSNTTDPASLSSDHIKFSCVKVDNSRLPELLPKGAGARVVAGGQLAWAVAALAGAVGLVIVA
ncbi:hypothetical protein MN608_11176 [Microdochium nivale]|nr:hypothetical protein MN608_11176 [Microdochium nivale]